MAMLRPKERATRSMISRSLLSGKSTESAAYPGKNRMNGSPMTIRRGLSGSAYTTNISISERIPMDQRSQSLLGCAIIRLGE